MALVLTTASSVRCPHGGVARLSTTNQCLECAGSMALVITDQSPILGCPFTLPGPKPSPCVRVTWLVGSAVMDADGVPVLTEESQGVCVSAEGTPQGPPTLEAIQQDVDDA